MADKDLLDDQFTQLQPSVSEFTFASLYLFRKAHRYEITQLGNSLILSGVGYGGEPYCLTPLGGDVRDATERLLSSGRELYAVDDRMLPLLSGWHGPLIIIEDRDAFDYVYYRSDLAMLPGNRFHKKRNRINYFALRHRYEVDVFGSQYCEGALQLLDLWLKNRVTNGAASLVSESAAAAEAVMNADQLGLQGVVILVEGSVRAFALGELLNGTTAVCHFEKADPFMEGLYQLVNQQFCQLCFTECEFINREQDLGEASLRTAKLSYHPACFVKKYRLKKTASNNL